MLRLSLFLSLGLAAAVPVMAQEAADAVAPEAAIAIDAKSQGVPVTSENWMVAAANPLAVQAGLGEYGRNGMLITKEFGPRLRLGKVFTDLPLESDGPIRFGVREFCEVCKRCAEACPVKALPHGEPSDEIINISTIRGVRKWSLDGERCFQFWASQNSDCSICIRVCPYNKDYSKWYYRLGRDLAGTRWRNLMLSLDVKMGYGERMRPKQWWQGARESLWERVQFAINGRSRKKQRKRKK